MGKFLQYFPSSTKLIFQSLGLKYFNNNEQDFWRKKKKHTWCLLWIYMYTSIYLYTYVYIYVCVCIYICIQLYETIYCTYTPTLKLVPTVYIYIYKMATFLACVCPRKGGLIVLDVCSCYLEGCNFIFHLFFPI